MVRLAFRDTRTFLLTMRLAYWILVVSLIAPLFSLPEMLRFVEGRLRTPRQPRWSPIELSRGVERILASGLIPDGACWKRAAVLRRFLRAEGIDASVAFGIRDAGQKLVGHAWLERQGLPYLEHEHPQYIVTFRHPIV
jgi:hypothetical protein